jgi:hypothetical protein
LFLLALIAAFALPLLLAWLLVGRWQPGGTANHGELLTPAQPVSQLGLQTGDGKTLDQAYLRGRWTLAYLGAADDARSRQGLYNIRQVRLALGKDLVRAQTLFLLTAPPPANFGQWLSQEHPNLTAGVADRPTLDFFSRAFSAGYEAGGWIYLIDPLGNLFMRYRVADHPRGMLLDLQRLLKYSSIG